MAGNRSERGCSHQMLRRDALACATTGVEAGVGQPPGKTDGEHALARVEGKGCDSQSFGAGARDVGGANISAAAQANVLTAEHLDQYVAERD